MGLPLVLPEEVLLREGGPARIGKGQESRRPVLFQFCHNGVEGRDAELSCWCCAFEVRPESMNGEAVSKIKVILTRSTA